MLKSKFSYLSFIVILLLISGLIYYQFFYKITILRLNDLATTNLSLDIRKKLLNPDHAGNFVYININNKNLNYFYIGNHIQRLTPLINTLQDIMQSHTRKIPNGDYLLSLEDGIHTTPPFLILAFASSKELIEKQQVVLIPDFESLTGYTALFNNIDATRHIYPWKDKISQVFWRGVTTMNPNAINDANKFSRLQFIKYANDLEFVNSGFTKITEDLPMEFKNEILNKYPLKEIVYPRAAIAYKYLMDVDGVSCTFSRMAWILHSQSVLFKHDSNNVQWYYQQLIPNVNYLPINSDFSNLQSQYEWAEANPVRSLDIANNAAKLSLVVFSKAAIEQSVITAFNNYHNNIISKNFTQIADN